MLVRNFTPFVPLLFPTRTPQRRDAWVFALRGTFRIDPGRPLEPDAEQHPVVESDRFHGDAGASSLYMESDIVPLKPRSDIQINAIATAPRGEKATDWVVRARVGTIEKALRVTGPRRWVKKAGGYRLTEPEPCLEVPIRYELAFGGAWQNERGDIDILKENPVGVGHVKAGEVPRGDALPAPQIEALDDPVKEAGKAYPPQGLGPLDRSWMPRRALAGTFDEAWKKNRWPEMPVDFSDTYYNAAHPDLIYPGYLRGGEEVRLEGLKAEEPLLFRMPKYRVKLIAKGARILEAATLELDTVMIDVPEGRAHLTWRALLPAERPLERFEVHCWPAGEENG